MYSSPRARRESRLGAKPARTTLTLLPVVIASLILAACNLSNGEPAPAPEQEAATPVALSQRCRGDGAVQTWLLLPLDPPESELMAAYNDRQVIEFQATVIGQDDDPARQPHRRFILREAAEGVTLILDYQGDPPPLVQGQSYRMVAWADLAPPASEPITTTESVAAGPALPPSNGYELQIFDSAGLLFVGLTDVDLQDDPLDIRLENIPGECAPVPAAGNLCVAGRQVQPLRIQWGQEELSLYPGDDGQLQHLGASYVVALFRNRQVTYAEPACADYSEHQRSLRIDRVQPPPVLPTLPPITGTLTTTLPITLTIPLTGTVPVPPAP